MICYHGAFRVCKSNKIKFGGTWGIRVLMISLLSLQRLLHLPMIQKMADISMKKKMDVENL